MELFLQSHCWLRGQRNWVIYHITLFIIDSMAFENISKQCHLVKADFIEILPGVMPKIIKKICKMGNIPVIAGGLVMDKEDVMAALSAGAISVSTTNQDVWLM